MDGVDQRIRDWVASLIGHPVTEIAITHAGPSRNGFAIEADGGNPDTRFYLQVESRTRPLAGTEFSPEREAEVLRAAERAGIPVPRVRGASTDLGALLTDFVPGSSDLHAASATERERIGRAYMRALADLHASTPGILEDLGSGGGLAVDAEADDPVRADLSRWEEIYEAKTGGGCPFVAAALEILADAELATRDRAFVHGDAGAGNFLHVDGHLEALIDWEIAHLGDVAEDLAWIRVREAVDGGLGPFADRVADYERASGTSIPAERVAQFEIVALAKCCMSFHIQETAEGWVDSPFAVETVMFGWLYRHLLAARMLALQDRDPADVEPGGPPVGVASGPSVPTVEGWLDVLRRQLKSLGALDGAWEVTEKRRFKGLIRLVDHLQFRSRHATDGETPTGADAGGGHDLDDLFRRSSWHVRSWDPIRRLIDEQGIALHA